MFVVRPDHRRQWYRYQSLFREFRLGELCRTQPGLIVALHRRAVDWSEATGSPVLALEHILDR